MAKVCKYEYCDTCKFSEVKGDDNLGRCWPCNRATTGGIPSAYERKDELQKSPITNKVKYYFAVEDIIFNEPATIIKWMDGTKTVVKCKEGETYDKEKGLAMAVMKRIYGRQFHRILKQILKDE